MHKYNHYEHQRHKKLHATDEAKKCVAEKQQGKANARRNNVFERRKHAIDETKYIIARNQQETFRRKQKIIRFIWFVRIKMEVKRDWTIVMTAEERIHQLEDKNKKLKSVIKELKEKLQKYSDYKTLNDNVIKEVIETANHVWDAEAISMLETSYIMDYDFKF